jgi:hypothetical protein
MVGDGSRNKPSNLEDQTMKAKVGDTIRIYAYPGTFEVTRIVDNPGSKHAEHKIFVGRDGMELFWTIDSSIVEVNGVPYPLNSCPLNAPASDYPHTPMFEYTDGPFDNAGWALQQWGKSKV